MSAKGDFFFTSASECKIKLRFVFFRFSSSLQAHMQTLMRLCPMKMPVVDHHVPTARKGSLTELSGPALQAVNYDLFHKR